MSVSEVGTPLSIIIPSYNRPDKLARTLRSIYSQEAFNCSEFEIVIVNDGSDLPYDVVRDLIIKNNNTQYLEYKKNKGVSFARNAAARIAAGAWLLFMDDDDEMADGYLSRLVEAIDNHKTAVAFWAGVEFISGEGRQCRTFEHEPQSRGELAKTLLSIGLAFGFALKKEIFFEIGAFNSKYQVGEDTDLFIRLLKTPYEIKPLNIIGVKKHEEHDSRLSTDFKGYSQHAIYENIFIEHRDFFELHPYVYVCLMSWALRIHLRHRDFKKAKELIRCLVLSGYKLDHIVERYKNQKDLSIEYLNKVVAFPEIV